MNGDKIKALLGFAVKSRKLLIGLDNIKECRGNIYSVFYDGTLSDKSRKELLFFASAKNAVVVRCDAPLGEITGKGKCKAAGLTDENLHNGIMKELDGGAGGYTTDNKDKQGNPAQNSGSKI